MAKMSITRGLAELKSLAERIDEATKSGMYVAVLKGKGDRRTVHNSPKSIETVTSEINASYQKVAALLLRRQAVKKAISDAKIETTLAELTFIAQNTVTLDEKAAELMLKLVEILDEHDDVQKVHANFDISDAVMEKIAAATA